MRVLSESIYRYAGSAMPMEHRVTPCSLPFLFNSFLLVLSPRWLPCSPLPVPPTSPPDPCLSWFLPALSFLVHALSHPLLRFLLRRFSPPRDLPPRLRNASTLYLVGRTSVCLPSCNAISYDFEGCVEGESVEEETFDRLFHVSCLK